MTINKTQIARNLRKEQTSAEAALWKVLRNRKFQNLKFRRQHPIKNYIVDFYCDELELVIELDGGYHNEKTQKENDETRDFHLSVLGYRVLRYTNEKVFDDLNAIYSDIITIKTQTEEHFKKTRAKHSNKLNNVSAPSQRERVGVRETLILSTKKLKVNQRDLILGAGFSVVDYDAIVIEFLDFKMPSNIENAIFTSQNGVASIQNSEFRIQNSFCVGQKTKSLLEKNGLKVIKMANNATELGEFIAKNHKNDSFHYFCGEQRRDELPDILKSNKIDISEVKTYKTVLFPKKFEQKWDGILFFSPSGVESYSDSNLTGMEAIAQQVRNDEAMAICIGETTATEARKHFKNVVVANSTSIESVIAKAVKILK